MSKAGVLGGYDLMMELPFKSIRMIVAPLMCTSRGVGLRCVLVKMESLWGEIQNSRRSNRKALIRILARSVETWDQLWRVTEPMVGASREQLLHDLVQELARDIEFDVSVQQDSHVRWLLYRRAAEFPAVFDLLLRTISIEPDFSVASAVVVMMLERVVPVDRVKWVNVLDPVVRRLPELRAREMDILDSVKSGSLLNDFNSSVVADWSDWLQHAVLESVKDRNVLAVLAQHARTKGIRRLALERLEALP